MHWPTRIIRFIKSSKEFTRHTKRPRTKPPLLCNMRLTPNTQVTMRSCIGQFPNTQDTQVRQHSQYWDQQPHKLVKTLEQGRQARVSVKEPDLLPPFSPQESLARSLRKSSRRLEPLPKSLNRLS